MGNNSSISNDESLDNTAQIDRPVCLLKFSIELENLILTFDLSTVIDRFRSRP